MNKDIGLSEAELEEADEKRSRRRPVGASGIGHPETASGAASELRAGRNVVGRAPDRSAARFAAECRNPIPGSWPRETKANRLSLLMELLIDKLSKTKVKRRVPGQHDCAVRVTYSSKVFSCRTRAFVLWLHGWRHRIQDRPDQADW